MKILAFGASTSTKSINKQLATYAAGLLDDSTVETLDLNDFEMPLFSQDKEVEIGQPELAKKLLNKIENADALVISFAEHNGSYTAAYKNIFDWCSRIENKVFQNTPTVMLSTSPGPGGAKSVLASATGSASFFAADLKASLSIPNFYDNFDMTTMRITDDSLGEQLRVAMEKLKM